MQLLADIKAVFEAQTEDRLPTKDLVTALHEMEERPWNDFRRGKPLSARQLGEMLRSFKITASSMRFSDGRNVKGYRLFSLKDVFSRYLGDSAVTTSQPNETAGYSKSRAVTPDTFVTAEKHEKPNVPAGCDVVTAEKGGYLEIYEKPVNLCIHCGQSIEPGQDVTLGPKNRKLHTDCVTAWSQNISPRNEMSE